MTRSIVTSGKTLDQAIDKALHELKAERHQVAVEVLQQPKTGLFGFKATEASVRVTLKTTIAIEQEMPQKPKVTDGLLWIENGTLHMSYLGEGGQFPTLLVDNKVKATYLDQPVAGRVVLEQGLDSFEVHLPEASDPVSEIRIAISDDRLEATVETTRAQGILYRLRDQSPAPVVQLQFDAVNSHPPLITANQVRERLREAGISFGTDNTVLEDTTFIPPQVRVMVARGKPVIKPTDAFIQYLFEDKPEVDMETHRVDHYEVRGVTNVEEGAEVAKKHPGCPGQDGFNVFGEVIPAPKPRDADWKVGEGVRISDDNLVAYASQAGLPLIQNGVLKVLKVYELSGDADVSTGHIRFKGEVIIRGNVCEKVKVETLNGGVHVYGMATGALIRADHDIVVEKNVVGSQLFAGGLTVVYLKLLSYIHSISSQVQDLLRACYLVREQSSLEDGKLVKSLLEIKFHGIPREIRDLLDYYVSMAPQLDSHVHALVSQLSGVFLGRGPLEISSISVIEDLGEQLKEWEALFEAESQQISHIRVKYLQNSRLEASGKVTIIGQGAYYSQVVAGKGFSMDRGVFRGGDIVVDEGDVLLKELGGPTGIATALTIVHDGKVTVGKVYPNVTITLQNQKYKFEKEVSQVKAFWSEGALRVYTGHLQLA